MFLFLVNSASIWAQEKNNYDEDFAVFRKEVNLFIDSAKGWSVEHGKYNVYTVFMYNTFPDSNSICFEVS